MPRPLLRLVLALVFVFVTFASQAFAQTSKAGARERGDLGVSYSTLYDHGDTSVTFPLGWVVAFSGNLTDHVAAVSEVSGNYKSMDVLGTSVSLSMHTFQGGVRVRGKSGQKTTAFGQVLAGLGHAAAGVLGSGASVNTFSIQPGVGVDVKMNDSTAFRAQGDYRMLHSADFGTANEFRFAFGVVFTIR